MSANFFQLCTALSKTFSHIKIKVCRIICVVLHSLFYTPFETFIEAVKDKPVSYYAFLTMYWTGIRVGELLALTLSDFNAEEKTLSITKSYQRINGRDIITEPKTAKGKRIITLPDFLVAELEEYVSKLYEMMADNRLFMVTKSYLEKEMIRGAKLSGVQKIRLHDLRHSHASLLISKWGGAQPNLVAERLGHEKIQTTLSTYSTCIRTNHAIWLISWMDLWID